MNILVVVAHHDDLEIGCGGSIAKLIAAGNRVTCLVMTNSEYSSAQGVVIRRREDAAAESILAARTLGYEIISIDQNCFDIAMSDANACHILRAIEQFGIDTVFTHWHGDSHLPHRTVSALTLHACRRIPRILGFAVNWYIAEEAFQPRFFTAIEDDYWQLKMRALACYRTEFMRAGKLWSEHLDRTTRNYGLQIGVNRAEGFIPYKFTWVV